MNVLSDTIMLAGAPPSGAFFSTFKPVFLLILLPPWLWAATWIDKDTRRVHSVPLMWNGLTLGAGALGVLLWLLLPWYAAGVVVYLLLVGAVIGAYVLHRNKRVVPEAKVLTAEHLRSLFARTRQQRVEVVEHLKLYNAAGKPEPSPPDEDPAQREAYNLMQELLRNVVVFRASRAELVPAGEEMSVRFLIDGVYHKRSPLPRMEAEATIDYLKRIAGLNAQDKRKPQTGSVSLDMGPVRADIKVSTDGTTHGQRMRLHVLQELAQTRLEQLGMPEGLRARMEQINAADSGLIIVSGPGGNGVTSTLYSLLRKHDAFMKQLVTLESSITVELENITQAVYKDQTELTGRLASMLRRDPDVVMVDECRTPRTASLLCEAAAKKNILLGASAENSFVALARWIKVCGDRAKAVAPLRAITCQVLLRKLCQQCREAYSPPRDLLAKLNLPADRIKSFFRTPTQPLTDEKGKPTVCAVCHGTGYYGRAAAFELLEMTAEIRDLILQDAPLNQIKAACRKNKMLYLQEQALRKVIEGTTGIKEVVRVSKSRQR